jgi:hypothetical protein
MTSDDIDPDRLRCAFHELGHVIGWRHAGITIKRVRVTGQGKHADGEVITGRQYMATVEQAEKYLIGLLAGPEAEIMWCALNKVRYQEHTAEGDMETLRKWRRNNPHFPKAITTTKLCRAARSLVQAKWSEIEQLAPRLASRGRL